MNFNLDAEHLSFSFSQIFDKALVEPKYSSMYAQLCKRLDEKSPVDPNRNITIFKFHLLNQVWSLTFSTLFAFAAESALNQAKRHLNVSYDFL